MPKPSTRADSATDSTCDPPVGMAAIDIEVMVQAMCQKAVEVLKTELMSMFSDITSRLQSVEVRLLTLEQKVIEHKSAMDDLSGRTFSVQSTVLLVIMVLHLHVSRSV